MPADMNILGALLGMPMRAQRVMPGAYDPTGQAFQQPDGGVSSELNAIIGGPGAYQMVPSLIPGMPQMENVLAGRRLSPEQIQALEQFASQNKSTTPTFKTVGEAEDYEKRRHEGLDKGYLPSNPNDMLNALILYLAQVMR